jgi:hypothetical protein
MKSRSRCEDGTAAKGHEDQFAPLQLRARYRFSYETFLGKHADTREAPIPAVRRTSGTNPAGRHQSLADTPLIVAIGNLWWPVSITI